MLENQSNPNIILPLETLLSHQRHFQMKDDVERTLAAIAGNDNGNGIERCVHTFQVAFHWSFQLSEFNKS